MSRLVVIGLCLIGFACSGTDPVVSDVDAGVRSADAGLADAASKDAGPPDTGPDDAGPVDVGVDAGIWPDATVPDAGSVDATVPDAGTPPPSCNATFTQVGTFENVRGIVPIDTRDMQSAWLSPNQKVLYAGLRRPHSTNQNDFAYDLWALTRTATSGPFTTATVTNLDLQGDLQNTSNERDIKHLLVTDRFWFSQGTDRFWELISASVPLAAQPALFTDFRNEVLALPQSEQNDDYRAPTLNADGLVLVSAKRDATTDTWDLVEHTRSGTADAFSQGRLLATLNSATNDDDPALSADGRRLLFGSSRTGTWNIYCSVRVSRFDPWSAPVVFGGTTVNTPNYHERAPFLHESGVMIYSQKQGGRFEEIMIATP